MCLAAHTCGPSWPGALSRTIVLRCGQAGWPISCAIYDRKSLPRATGAEKIGPCFVSPATGLHPEASPEGCKLEDASG